MNKERFERLRAFIIGQKKTIKSIVDKEIANLDISGLDHTHIVYMDIISQEPGISPTAVAERAYLHKSSASRVVPELIHKGIVYKERDKSDNRMQRLYLTDKGQALVNKTTESANGIIARLFDGFTENEVDELIGYLERIRDNALRD